MKIIFIILTLLWTSTLYADITQTSNLNTIQASIQKSDQNTLIVFDIDDVLLTAKDQILKPAYKAFNNELAKEIQSRISKESAEELWSIIMLNADYELVNPMLIPLIKDNQSKGIKVIGLTNILTGHFGKIPSIEEWDINRLKKYNINFNESWHNIPQMKFLKLKTTETTTEANRFATFKEGILFAAGLPKGKVLQTFLRSIHYKPNKIIFIDDKLLHLESMELFCKEENIAFMGFQYTAVRDNNRKPFNEERARLQFKILEEKHLWLSDDKAMEQIEFKTAK